ncbi:MAG: GlxA family transcriptional regulator [Gammaproteobacteria bacterium]|nr:GlxA family transcriptional regulator [Gammaproteobacteria bacterium]MBU1489537.1 GlxA family transcriptional regulator [Gammaproteobacteria bacterium]MBU2067036.1 GlxA family transcriptional regulator [Gammaproteobacteria bacterium]MBU2139694.1 GlxA family transcriptional regulator [Gammaproteobacteria bacterium]MBU2215511.1 GlxA family transcriptional regulator [Gammaproteobacteria bacterium]
MPQTFCFLLLPGFSMMGLMSAIEPLRVANRFRGELYRWHLLSQDGTAVAASNGMSLNVDAGLEPAQPMEALFVVAGFEPLASYDQRLAHWLQRREPELKVLGGIDTGSFVLAEAGLFQRQRLTLHWEAIDAFRERYPNLEVTQELFEIDGRRITSAGGTSSLDLMLSLIAQAHGEALAVQVSEQFVVSRIRTRQDHQRMQVASRYDLHNKKLVRVIGEMERHSEQPLPCEALAERVGITMRQLERLFRHHLHSTPSAFYLGLRLDKARQLLRQSDLSVLEVSLACGFDSASYFSRCYRKHFAASPSQDRHERPA